jgi:two-component system, NtrC family, sensor histidine kinase HydH
MNSKLLLRITAPAVLIGLVLIGACFAGVWYIQRLQSNLTGVLMQNVRSLQAAQELEIRVRQLRYHTLVYLADPSELNLQPVAADQRNFEQALSVVRQTATSDDQKACVQAIEQDYEQYRDELAKRRAKAGAGTPALFDKVLDRQPLRLVVVPSEKLVGLNRERMEQVVEESRVKSAQANAALLVLGIAGSLSGIFMGYGVARGLSRSLYRLSVRVQDMAQHLDRDVGSVSVVADGDLNNLDLQLGYIVRRVEEAAARLQQQQRELLRAEQLAAVGQLAASVAHEVRNPLTGIKMLVEAALRSNNSKPLNLEDLQVIHREITRLEQTVQGFLNFARLPAPQRSRCDLRTVVQQAVDLVGARARQIKVDVAWHPPPEPVEACIDSSQLQTVLVNLFLNALDAMPNGGCLDVVLAHCGDTGVRITVADTGTGIPPHIAARLFTPFTTTKPTGTGLGLSISGRILEEHGGSISASNRPEGGACFVIQLPSASSESVHADPARR